MDHTSVTEYQFDVDRVGRSAWAAASRSRTWSINVVDDLPGDPGGTANKTGHHDDSHGQQPKDTAAVGAGDVPHRSAVSESRLVMGVILGAVRFRRSLSSVSKSVSKSA